MNLSFLQFQPQYASLIVQSNSEPLKTKSVIKKQGSVKFGGSGINNGTTNKKTLERTLSLPAQKVTFVFNDEDDDDNHVLSEERTIELEKANPSKKEKNKLQAKTGLKQVIDDAHNNKKNRRGTVMAKKNKSIILIDYLSINPNTGTDPKSLEKALSLLPKKSSFFYLSQSFTDTNDVPSATKLPENNIINEEDSESPVTAKNKDRATSFDPFSDNRQAQDYSPSPIKNSAATKDLELSKKGLQVLSYNTSFDHEELFPAKMEGSLNTPPEMNHGSPCFEYSSTIDDGEAMADKLDAALRRRAVRYE